MTTDDGSILERGHLAGLAVVPVWERGVVCLRARVFLDERNHPGTEGFIRQGCCCPELPICGGKYE